MPSAIGKAWHPPPKPPLWWLFRTNRCAPQWEPTGVWFKKLPDNWVGEGMDKTLYTYRIKTKKNRK